MIHKHTKTGNLFTIIEKGKIVSRCRHVDPDGNVLQVPISGTKRKRDNIKIIHNKNLIEL